MKHKILIVDDCRTAIMMEKMIFRRLEFDIIIADNGKKAVDLAIAEQPDIILMDVVMPVMNGFEAVREIRKHEPLRHVPIIMVTTRGEAINREEGLQAGCTDYITKPFNAAQLLERVRAHLEEEVAERQHG